jgi:hypothetical protein
MEIVRWRLPIEVRHALQIVISSILVLRKDGSNLHAKIETSFVV